MSGFPFFPRIRQFALLGLAVFGLAACEPPPPPIEIRPGIGQSVDLDAIRPPLWGDVSLCHGL